MVRVTAEWRSVARFYGLAIAISWVLWSQLVLSRTGLGILPFAMPMPWTVGGTQPALLTVISPNLMATACVEHFWFLPRAST